MKRKILIMVIASLILIGFGFVIAGDILSRSDVALDFSQDVTDAFGEINTNTTERYCDLNRCYYHAYQKDVINEEFEIDIRFCDGNAVEQGLIYICNGTMIELSNAQIQTARNKYVRDKIEYRADVKLAEDDTKTNRLGDGTITKR